LPEQIQTIVDNLASLGTRRLALMGGIAALVMAIVAVGAIYLNKPAYETLYVGLDRSDVNQIGMVLGEAGIRFDVDSNGTSVLVAAGKTAQARMLLAEKGLPTSANAGYELFDNVGSLGLTTFMQQVTRVRALEGEIARTIQSINGIKAARVHIVMAEQASFRREQQEPSASVVIRTDGNNEVKTAGAIRHLVAAAVPGLTADKVTILDSSGRLLADGEDPSNNSAVRSMTVQSTVEAEVQENIRRALAPYLGPDNFRASVMANVNTDQRQIEETIYDPKSRVERSVQTVKTSNNSNQQSATTPATVTQNLPQQPNANAEGPKSSEESERREETTNYEISSKRIATTSNGYSIEKLSIAVVVNRARIMEILGDKATPEQVDQRVADIQKVVASAAGLNADRGDVLEVSAVEFIDGLDGVEVPQPGVMDWVSTHAGTLINAAAFILVVFLVTWFGLRPMTAALTKPAALEAPENVPSLPKAVAQGQLPSSAGEEPIISHAVEDPGEDIQLRMRSAPQERLARMVDLSDERTAHIVRTWVQPAEPEAV
jgi:flagellar M-ring protein FliF